MKNFFEKIKERICKKAIRDLCCCHWYDEDEEPLTKAEMEELLKKIEEKKDKKYE